MYFADEKSVAEHYYQKLKDRFETVTYQGQPLQRYSLPVNDPLRKAQDIALRMDGQHFTAREAIDDYVSSYRETVETFREAGRMGAVAVYEKVANEYAALNPDDFKGGWVDTGKLYKVEIPDENYLLWDRPIIEMQTHVQVILREMGFDVPRPDGKTLEKIKKLRWQIDDELELQDRKANSNYDRLFRLEDRLRKLQGMTGKEIYYEMQRRSGLQDNEVTGPRAASVALNKAGIPGIKFLDENSRLKGDGTYNYVIFDDQAIKILDKFYQDAGLGQPAKGGVDFVNGKAIIHAWEGGDVSTIIHENAHVFLQMMRDAGKRTGNLQLLDDLNTFQDWARLDQEGNVWTAVNGNGNHTITQRGDSYFYRGPSGQSREFGSLEDAQYVLEHEMFARGFERYLAEGKAPTPALLRVFAHFKTWLLKIYQAITGSAIDVNLTPEMKQVFDRLLGGDNTQQKIAKPSPIPGEPRIGINYVGPDGKTDAERGRPLTEDERARLNIENMVRDSGVPPENVVIARPGADRAGSIEPESWPVTLGPDELTDAERGGPYVAPTEPATLATEEPLPVPDNEASNSIYRNQEPEAGQPIEYLRPPTVPERDVMGAWIDNQKLRTRAGREIMLPDLSKIKKVADRLRLRDAWLVDQAIAEAKFLNDDYNLGILNGVDRKRLTPADRDIANDYLFGVQDALDLPRHTTQAGDLTTGRNVVIEPLKVSDIVTFEGANGNTRTGRITRILDDGRLEIRDDRGKTWQRRPGDVEKVMEMPTVEPAKWRGFFKNGDRVRFEMDMGGGTRFGVVEKADIVGTETRMDVRGDDGVLYRPRKDRTYPYQPEAPAAPPEPSAGSTEPAIQGEVYEGPVNALPVEENARIVREYPMGMGTAFHILETPNGYEVRLYNGDSKDLAGNQRPLYEPSAKSFATLEEAEAFVDRLPKMPEAEDIYAGLENMRKNSVDVTGWSSWDVADMVMRDMKAAEAQPSPTETPILDTAPISAIDEVFPDGIDDPAKLEENLTKVQNGEQDLSPTPPAPINRESTLLNAIVDRLDRGEFFAKSRDFENYIKAIGFNLEQELDLNLAYDIMEGAYNLQARKIRAALDARGASLAERLTALSELENNLTEARRTLGKMALQQFSTPITLGEAAGVAADVRPGDIVGEPTAGTANLVDKFHDRTDVQVRVNEIDEGRRSVLSLIGYDPTGLDLMKPEWVIINGKKAPAWATVQITNPPWGAYSTGKYGKAMNVPVVLNDWSQRFTYLELMRLADDGRMVGVMPTNWVELLNRSTRETTTKLSGFYWWLKKNYTVQAIIESPEGAYKNRGTDIGSLLVVIDKTPPSEGHVTLEAFGDKRPADWAEYAALVEQIPHRTEGAVAHAIEQIRQANQPTGPDASGLVDPNAIKGVGDADVQHIGQPAPRTDEGTDATGRTGERIEGPGAEDTALGNRPNVPEPSIEGGDTGPGLVDGDTGRVQEPVQQFTYSDEFQAKRAKSRATAKDSRSFVEYVDRSPLKQSDARHVHPSLVVETKSLSGVPYPALEEAYRPSPSVMRAVRNHTISVEGNLDPAWAAIQQNDKNHMGMLVADDVGTGKTRTGAAFVIDRIEKGRKRILVVTDADMNVNNLMREYPKVYSGVANENGGYMGEPETPFPAKMLFLKGENFPEVKKKLKPIPTFDEPVVYFISSKQFADFAEQIVELKVDAVVVDEAHEFKNIGTKKRGPAWIRAHQDWTDPKRDVSILYLTATPGADISDLQYLYGLKVWSMDGFRDWVNVITGVESPEKVKARQDARVVIDDWASKVEEARDLIDQEPATLTQGSGYYARTYEGIKVGNFGIFHEEGKYGRYGFEYKGKTYSTQAASETEMVIEADMVNKMLEKRPAEYGELGYARGSADVERC